MNDVEPGPVEVSTRAFVVSLGVLSARNAVMAAAAVRTAQLLDVAEGGAAAKALSHELRQLLSALEPNRANVPAPAPSTVQARTDAVDAAKDQLAARRQQRQAGAS